MSSSGEDGLWAIVGPYLEEEREKGLKGTFAENIRVFTRDFLS